MNRPRPKVLVLLAAYNGSRWIESQIDSIANQTGVDVDIVASDDGSTDDTPRILADLAGRRRLRLTHPASPTGSAAQNFFFLMRSTAADGFEFVALADQDDLWEPEKLERGCAALRDRAGDAYSCAVTAFWEDGRESVLCQPAAGTATDFLFEGAGQGCTFILTQRFYLKLRDFLLGQSADTAAIHYHDWAIYAIARAWSVPWVFDARPMVRYRQHESNDTGARGGFAGIRKRMRLIMNGWYAGQLHAIVGLCRGAAPANAEIEAWDHLLRMPPCWARKWRMTAFVLRGGRRRRIDRLMVCGAVLAGWI